jgi:hypothetical protein
MIEEERARLIRLYKRTAGYRRDTIDIPNEFYEDAVNKIQSENIVCDRYPGGMPTAISVYKYALILFNAYKLDKQNSNQRVLNIWTKDVLNEINPKYDFKHLTPEIVCKFEAEFTEKLKQKASWPFKVIIDEPAPGCLVVHAQLIN